MKPTTILTTTGIHRGIHNEKAGLVSYIDHNGQLKYISETAIIPAFLRKQAF